MLESLRDLFRQLATNPPPQTAPGDDGLLCLNLPPEMTEALNTISIRENVPVDELAADLLAWAAHLRLTETDKLVYWHMLTRREQQAAALACIGYKNKEIARKMGITVETVKAHLSNVYQKFGVQTRGQLAMLLSDWDFSAWDVR